MCELTDFLAEGEAILRFKRGEKPNFSSNIAGQLTCGYGVLSPWGDWEFPLYPAENT